MIRVVELENYLQKRIVVEDSYKDTRIVIHPWNRQNPEVYIAVGDLKKDGHPKKSEQYECVIINREDFVEGILAVFPELKRA